MEIDLITGRPHQIRVQLAKTGLPIWGDYKYGAGNEKPGRDLALRAVGLSFLHPTTKEKLDFLVLPEKIQPWNIFEF